MPGNSDLRRWLDRAERARAKALDAGDPRSKRVLIGLAGTYERMAAQIELPKMEASGVASPAGFLR